jgi:uncharacterized protein YcbX
MTLSAATPSVTVPCSEPASAQASQFHARLSELWIYPIKSCAGVSVQEAVLTPMGLASDRMWMVVDASGDMVTQRDLPRMASIQPKQVPASNGALPTWQLQAPGMTDLPLTPCTQSTPVAVRVWQDTVPAFDMGPACAQWLTEFLGLSRGPLRLVQFDARHKRVASMTWTQGVEALNQFSDGFPVLVASTASLAELNARLAQQGVAAVDMRRFRPNVVLGDASEHALLPHDEDRVGVMTIHADSGAPLQLQPVKPCPRCPIPNIDPDTALTAPSVGDALQQYRQDARVDGGITFGMNAIAVQGVGQLLRVGQCVSADWVF